jgi:hypothetical protein
VERAVEVLLLWLSLLDEWDDLLEAEFYSFRGEVQLS